MTKKIICFRFDVDTYLCASTGVYNLIKLAEKTGSKFTFFYNMGRAVHYRVLWNKYLDSNPNTKIYKLSNLYKLGKTGVLKTFFTNPFVGKSYPHNIIEASKARHEIGLHGGRNHGDWMMNANNWSAQKIKKEIEWGLSELKNVGINNINSFSSPGWQGSQYLIDILIQNNISILADNHGYNLERIENLGGAEKALYSIPTNLLGEPGGVGYIENMRAQGLNKKEMETKFKSDIGKVDKLAVFYEHPYYAGIHELSTLELLINIAIDAGFCVSKFSEVPEKIFLK